jgi:hypothetical protein
VVVGYNPPTIADDTLLVRPRDGRGRPHPRDDRQLRLSPDDARVGQHVDLAGLRRARCARSSRRTRVRPARFSRARPANSRRPSNTRATLPSPIAMVALGSRSLSTLEAMERPGDASAYAASSNPGAAAGCVANEIARSAARSRPSASSSRCRLSRCRRSRKSRRSGRCATIRS